jgi:probable HAF family extracellular repeat protein
MPVYNYTTLDDPFQVGFTTGAMGINDAGQIVGGYTNASGGHGFLYSGGIYTPIDDRLATKGTGAAGINSVGQIVGGYGVGTVGHGFLLSGGTYTTLDYPSTGVTGTDPSKINASGQVVGTYFDNSGTREHGFLYSEPIHQH